MQSIKTFSKHILVLQQLPAIFQLSANNYASTAGKPMDAWSFLSEENLLLMDCVISDGTDFWPSENMSV